MKKRISLLAATLLAIVAVAPLPAHAITSCLNSTAHGWCVSFLPDGPDISNDIVYKEGKWTTDDHITFHATPESTLRIIGSDADWFETTPNSMASVTATHLGVVSTSVSATWSSNDPTFPYSFKTNWDNNDEPIIGNITITSPQPIDLYDHATGSLDETINLDMKVTGKPDAITLSNGQSYPVSWSGDTGSATFKIENSIRWERWVGSTKDLDRAEKHYSTINVALTSQPEVTLTGVTIDGEILDTEEVAMGWTHIMAYANNPSHANVVVTFSDGTQVNATKSSHNDNGTYDYVARYQGREQWVHVQPDQLTGISIDGTPLQEFSDRETNYTVWSDHYYGHTITGTTLSGRTVQFEPKGPMYFQRVGGNDYTLTVNVPLEGIQIDGVPVPNFTSETHEYTVAVANPNNPSVSPQGTGPFKVNVGGGILTVSSHGIAYTFHLTQATRLNTLPSTGGAGVVALAVLAVTLLIGGAALALSNRHRN